MPTRGPLPFRRACTRCHAHKLACPGRIDQEQRCARCIKAKVPCIFGTSVRGMRPATVAAAGLRTASDMDHDATLVASNKCARRASKFTKSPPEQATAVSESLTMASMTTLPAIDCSSFTTNLFHQDSSSDNLVASHALYPTEANQSEAHIQVVQTLTKLNLDLLQHFNTIPLHALAPLDPPQDKELFHLDHTFQLTKVMLDVIQTLQLPGTFYLTAPEATTIDTASIFLVISCWHRLADIYESIFLHIKKCAEESATPAAASDASVRLPSVRIGTYRPSPTLSVLLQMVAALHHSTLLAHAMIEFAAKLEDSLYYQSTVFINPVAIDKKTCDDIQVRATSFHDQVKSIEGILLRVGLF
ncbi:hypothetical protein JX265_008330 [Neoarthrinium moseri]|uniref:Zn(2)-C6 fungal-type domain-containing protein n=1 Tax=Neoarthrinium moseri TaxID=1658444 RepID=A0A9P9WHT1_9PEZI|nr:hypothetical protein JX265_008330 [Neoarthrinium moseri]